MFTASLGGHQKLLINNPGWRRLRRHEHELEPVEDGALGMMGAVDSCHGQDRNPKNEPGLWGMP